MRLDNRHGQAQKAMTIYHSQGKRTAQLALEYERLYDRFIEQEARAKVRASLNKGEVYTLEGSDDENEGVNQSLKDIQANPLLSQEQRRMRVEAEVGQEGVIHIGHQIHDPEQKRRY